MLSALLSPLSGILNILNLVKLHCLSLLFHPKFDSYNSKLCSHSSPAVGRTFHLG